MSLMGRLHTEMTAARRGTDEVAKSLLVTLYAEAGRVGKDDGNRESTDGEVIQTVRKFLKNVDETVGKLEAMGRDASQFKREGEILRTYLPAQLSEDELKAEIGTIVAGLPDRSPKAMGQVMAALKQKHGANYDGKLASALVKQALA